MDGLIKRLKEPSTWRGVTGILALLGIAVTPELSDAIIAVAVGLVSIIEILRKEKAGAK